MERKPFQKIECNQKHTKNSETGNVSNLLLVDSIIV
jgi:hypothetical protein